MSEQTAIADPILRVHEFRRALTAAGLCSAKEAQDLPLNDLVDLYRLLTNGAQAETEAA